MPPFQVLNSHRAFWPARLVIFLGFVASCGWLEQSLAARSPLNIRPEDTEGTLAEIKNKRRVALLIVRSSVVDASGTDDRIVAEALAVEPRESLKHRYSYSVIARKLNEYIRKYRSLRPASEIAQADFLIYFRLVEYRRTLNGFYPYGELFVIVDHQPAEIRSPRVIWKTRKIMFAEDAVKALVKQLKQVREEH